MNEVKGIRIGEVARQSGVPVSTVKHYYREGLLPEPILKRRNSAYYSEATVERVKLIKRLQEQAFLPLKVVKALFDRTTDPHVIRQYLPGRDGMDTGDNEGRTPVAAFTSNGFMSADELDNMANLGLIHPLGEGDNQSFGRLDTRVLNVLVKLRKLGLTPERGFGAEQLMLYREHLQRLVRMEVTMALEGMVGRMSPNEVQRVAPQILEAATELVAALHRKEIARALGERG